MRVIPPQVAIVVAAALAVAAAGQTPPPETTERLDSAFHALGAERFTGSFTVSARSDVAKLSGKDREESLEVRRITMRPGEEPVDELVRAEENGEDVTAETREREAEREPRARSDERDDDPSEQEENDEGGTLSAFLKLPMGENLDLYRFSGAVHENGALVATFAPLPEHADQEGMASGRLAWNVETGDPLWIEATPVDLPRGAKELSLRFEVARHGELLYIGRTTTDGVGGILWIKRRFHVDVEISDVVPAG